MAYEHEMRILGGLPVTVEFTIDAAEPDVGIMSDGVSEWEIVAVNGKYAKKGAKNPFKWVYDRIEKKEGEDKRILDELNELDLSDYFDDYYEDY
jgi:hypothetical protein